MLARPEDIVRIECIERATTAEPGDGLFQLRYLREKFSMDYRGLLKELRERVSQNEKEIELIAERLQNFRKVYINLRTMEVST